jgi:creatinine amidohydrolase/Fe(II)-dependent formamide hydrolase-like protein
MGDHRQFSRFCHALVWGMLALSAMAPNFAQAEGQKGLPWLTALTWVEARTQLADPKTVIVVPVGSVEARGPHLPLGARSMVLSEIVERAARADGHTVLAPVLAVSPQASEDDPGALRWPGTLHSSPGTLGALLGEVMTSLKVHGAQRLVLVTTSPEALGVLRETAAVLGDLWAEQGVQIIVAEAVIDPVRDARLLAEQKIADEPEQARGGALETSEMLACCAATVRMAQLPRTPAAVEASGVEGWPQSADLAVGRRSLRLKSAAVEQAIERVRIDSGR